MIVWVVLALIGVAGDPQLGELDRQLHHAQQEQIQLDRRIRGLQRRSYTIFLDRCEQLVEMVESRVNELEGEALFEWLEEELPGLFAEERRKLSEIIAVSPELRGRAEAVLGQMLRLITQLKEMWRDHL